jgi:hypothetical protein
MFSARVTPAAAESAKDMEPGVWTGSGGHRWIRFGKYTWRVLKVAVNKGRKEALLLAEDAVEKRPFNRNRRDGNDWKTSDIREWLNDDFYRGAFSEGERGAILTAYYRYGGRYAGSERTDSSKIFLLSANEAINRDFFDGQDDRVTRWDGQRWKWWLRSPGDFDDNAALVGDNGEVYISGPLYVISERVIRPALILNLSSSIFTSSSSQYEVLYGQEASESDRPLDLHLYIIR